LRCERSANRKTVVSGVVSGMMNDLPFLNLALTLL